MTKLVLTLSVLLTATIAYAAATERPVAMFNRDMQPEYYLVDDGGHIRTVSDVRSQSADHDCAVGWRTIFVAYDERVCGKPTRSVHRH